MEISNSCFNWACNAHWQQIKRTGVAVSGAKCLGDTVSDTSQAAAVRAVDTVFEHRTQTEWLAAIDREGPFTVSDGIN